MILSKNDQFNRMYAAYHQLVENDLHIFADTPDAVSTELIEAMKYSLYAGGKRIRPVLCLAVNDMINGKQQDVMSIACAIEFIHTYSLIHDDLPAMDDDALRRGKPTSHIVFGEAAAILAGDALLNRAFEIMLSDAVVRGERQSSYIKAVSFVANAAGSEGMIGGQSIDIAAENLQIDLKGLQKIHKNKTGALIKASIIAPLIANDVEKHILTEMTDFADNLGLVFQIKDDILDAEGDAAKMGKMTGSDDKKKKSTYVSLLGVEKAKEKMAEAGKRALGSLDKTGLDTDFLSEMTMMLISREK